MCELKNCRSIGTGLGEEAQPFPMSHEPCPSGPLPKAAFCERDACQRDGGCRGINPMAMTDQRMHTLCPCPPPPPPRPFGEQFSRHHRNTYYGNQDGVHRPQMGE